MFPIPEPKLLAVSLLLVATALAGCTGGPGDGDDGGPTTPATTAKQPAPKGDGLSASEIATLIAAYNDQPFQGGQGSPEHVSKWVTEDTFISLHFNHAEPAQATKLLWIVLGVKGVFCSEAQPGGGPSSGFTHFHKWQSADWDAGHGGAAGDQGYWLLHLGVDTFSAPAWDVEPGTDYSFMPTPAPSCGGNVPAVNFSPPGAGALSAAEIATLNAAFNDQPFQGGQGSPEHVSKWVTENAFIGLHWNNADPAKATGLLWYVLGVRGEFCDSKQPHDDFTHFHQGKSASWDGGHGGAAGDQGYWLLHTGVDTFSAPAWDVEPGVDRSFMPTPVPDC